MNAVEELAELRRHEMGHATDLYTQQVIEVDINCLKHHSLNEELYGTSIDPDFVESVRTYGVQEPITICRSTDTSIDGFVVKGRRRCLAASVVGINRIKAFEWFCEDENEFRKQLILSNVRNPVPLDQKIKMFEALKDIEAKHAQLRLSEYSHQKIPQGEKKGESSSLAATAVGISRSTAERGSKALKVADVLRNGGRAEEADDIVRTLNTEGARPALVKAEEAAASIPQPELPMPSLTNSKSNLPESTRLVDKTVNALANAISSATLAMGAVVRAIDAKKAADGSGFNAGHKAMEDKLKLIDNYLSDSEAAVTVLREKWSAAKKGNSNGSV